MTGSDQSESRSPVRVRWAPHTEAERKAVREELARLLADPLFKNSKRYPSFLEYVVEQTLNGQAESLKERTVGIEVFRRAPDYDTNADHMVRNVAAEVRKRLNEYYETAPGPGIRIDIPAGSYVPQFRLLERPTEPEPTPSPAPPAKLEEPSAPPKSKGRTAMLLAGAAVLTLAIAALVYLRPGFTQSSLERFWGPIWKTAGPMIFCIAGPEGFPVEPGPDVPRLESLADNQRYRNLVTFSDCFTLLRIALLAQAHGKDYRLIYSRDARVSDLYSGSAVLVGTGDDELVRIMSAPFRFHFQHDGPVSRIVDTQNAKQNDWTVNWLTPYNQVTRDYAIFWRTRERFSGKYTVGIAGVTRIAVAAGGELLANPESLGALDRALPRGWQDKNLEVVLRIQVDRGSPYPPEVIATQVW